MAVVKYKNTIGLNADVPGYDRPALVQIRYDLHDDGLHHLSVESARTMGAMPKLGKITKSPAEIEDLLTFDKVQTFKNLAALFGITV